MWYFVMIFTMLLSDWCEFTKFTLLLCDSKLMRKMCAKCAYNITNIWEHWRKAKMWKVVCTQITQNYFQGKKKIELAIETLQNLEQIAEFNFPLFTTMLNWSHNPESVEWIYIGVFFAYINSTKQIQNWCCRHIIQSTINTYKTSP